MQQLCPTFAKHCQPIYYYYYHNDKNNNNKHSNTNIIIIGTKTIISGYGNESAKSIKRNKQQNKDEHGHCFCSSNNNTTGRQVFIVIVTK
jgi:hypothetical protein